MPGRGKISSCGARTPPFAVDRDFAAGETLGSLSVDILGSRISSPPCGLHERLVKEFRGVDRNDVQRTVRSMIEVLATPARLGPFEVRQDIRVPPTVTTQIAPLIKVARVPSHVEHAVDR